MPPIPDPHEPPRPLHPHWAWIAERWLIITLALSPVAAGVGWALGKLGWIRF